ncbi:uncharacterized protein BCR38DRAFT_503528 [Pseudomassariella vexata]|uniref:Uncharacterized protein n=1 Tax=Pseudomassariella vexata TaxID=1141098 RepID=A0A1Y2EF92_9PEZI|nr:uncharacterized protein BCR38DRAFT_503528 [Pseudomassariella vexata]ORY70242.1 hypothetical protein BCR38DRAFT_503528 [Pseudomassariella vexata]
MSNPGVGEIYIKEKVGMPSSGHITPSRDSSATLEITDADLTAIRARIQLYEELKELKATEERLKAKLIGAKRPGRCRRSSESSSHKDVDLFDDIPIFKQTFSLRQRDAWLFMLTHTEDSYSRIEDGDGFTGDIEARIAEMLENARQRKDQDPEDFSIDLASLESKRPAQDEAGSALYFYGKLQEDLQCKLKTVFREMLPRNRQEIVHQAAIFGTSYNLASGDTTKRLLRIAQVRIRGKMIPKFDAVVEDFVEETVGETVGETVEEPGGKEAAEFRRIVTRQEDEEWMGNSVVKMARFLTAFVVAVEPIWSLSALEGNRKDGRASKRKRHRTIVFTYAPSARILWLVPPDGGPVHCNTALEFVYLITALSRYM